MHKFTKTIGQNLKQYAMVLMLVVIILFFYFLTNGTVLKPMNVSNIIFQNGYVVILAVGMLMCILTGGNIDLSVGSVVALIAACAATFTITWKWNVYISIVLCLGIGILIGMWQGFWIAYVRIPPFIVTLSGMLLFRGMTLIVLNGLTIAPFPPQFLALSTGFVADIFGPVDFLGIKNLTCFLVGILIAVVYCVMQILGYRNKKRKGYATGSVGTLILRMVLISAVVIALFLRLAQYRGIPTVLITLGVILVVYSFITQRTVMGRQLYALGGNEKAARLSGVKTNRLLFLAYANMSFLAAVAGIVFAGRLNASSPQAGVGFEMDAIASNFIGGASAYGGIGTVSGTLIGALVMGLLNNGMSIMGVDSNWQQVVKGLVLLAAVAFDVISKQRVPIPIVEAFKNRRNARRSTS